MEQTSKNPTWCLVTTSEHSTKTWQQTECISIILRQIEVIIIQSNWHGVIVTHSADFILVSSLNIGLSLVSKKKSVRGWTF